MGTLTKEALLVRDSLLEHGLETPLNKKTTLNHETCKYRISEHVTEIMKLLNLDLMDDSLSNTPNRIAKMYIEEIFSGLFYENFPKISIFENKMNVEEVITIRDIILISTCEHHFLFFDGKATVSYIPNKNIIGLSKIHSIVKFFAQRPQVQERLTKQIFLALQTLLSTNDVVVSINAIHYCVKALGIRDTTSVTTTTASGGLFKSNKYKISII